MDFQSRNQPAASQVTAQVSVDAGLRRYMQGIYNYMSLGLLISGLVALALSLVPELQSVFFRLAEVQGQSVLQPNILGWVAMLSPLGILLFASFKANSLSASTVKALYWAFVALQGVGLTLIFQAYTGESLVRVFFITAASFAGLSLYGYTTKRDLSPIGSFLLMGLFGLIIASIVSIFWSTPAFQFMISVGGVLIFAGLIAFDTQRLKEQYSEAYGSEVLAKSAVFGALSLYLDFLNLFMFLLRLLGDRR